MIVCFYHKSDFDGKGSAASVFFSDLALEHGPIKLIGKDHPEQFHPEEIEGADYVVLVDYSFRPEKMLALSRIFNDRFIWIDHHKSAIEASKAYSYQTTPGLRNTEYAACELSWLYFFGQANYPSQMPKGIKAMGRRDIWDLENKEFEPGEILTFHYGAEAYLSWGSDPNPLDKLADKARWSDLLHDQAGTEAYQDILQAGKIAEQYATNVNSAMIESTAFLLKWEGLTFLAANIFSVSSQVFDLHPKAKEVDGFMNFGWDPVSKSWKVTLKNSPDNPVILLPIAQKYGGGGHPHACGFHLDSLDFLSTKKDR